MLGTTSKQETPSEKQTPLRPKALLIGDSRSSSPLIIGIFVLVFAFFSVSSFLQKSPTVDEPVHLFSGYSYLKWGDFRANPEHPPLAKLLAALPLLAFEIKDPRPAGPYWDLIPSQGPRALHTVNVAGKMLFVDNDAETLFFYAKLMMVAIGILLGLFVFRWSNELFGGVAAIASLFIYSLDPGLLAHGRLVHTDLPFTTFFFIGTYFFWRVLNQLTWSNLFLAALFFGLGAITKYAYVAVLLVWGILGIVKLFSTQPQQCSIGTTREVSSRWGKMLLLSGVLTCALVTAYLFIWTVYNFRFDAIAAEALHLPLSEEMPEKPLLRSLVSFLIEHRLFPEAWIYGQLHVFNNLKRDAYLLGRYSDQGFWLYFPVAFAVKTPLPTLFLLMGTIAMWIIKRREQKPGLFLLIPVVVYFTLGVASGMNIGLRHILPIYPFLFVMIGGTVAELWKGRAWFMRGGLISLGLWYLWSSISIHPHYLAFFNELVGGPKNGHKVLLDSNLDWGQDLKGLKRWMDKNGVKKIQFLYFGYFNIVAPQYYGIDAFYLPGSWVSYPSPASGNLQMPNYLAISVNQLYGTFLLKQEQPEFIEALTRIKPITTVGHTIFIYSMDEVVEFYSRAVQINPHSAELHYVLANLLDNQRKTDEAIEHYREAVKINPGDSRAHNKLGISLAERGDFNNAIQHFGKVLELDEPPTRKGTWLTAHFHLGTLLAKQGHFREAINHYQEVLKIKPNFAAAYHHLGLILAAKGDLNKAINYFQEALRIEPDFADAHESLGQALAEQGKRDEAVKHFEEALRIMKSRPKSHTGH
jgi:Tfp pilus assembly protein PilF